MLFMVLDIIKKLMLLNVKKYKWNNLNKYKRNIIFQISKIIKENMVQIREK